MSEQEIFQRYEKKYLLEEGQFQLLKKELEGKMTMDQYGKHTICNIYFDTPDYLLIRTSIEKPVYKEKLRLRSYGIPKEEDLVFVELKKKYYGIVYKRRAAMKMSDARAYLYEGKREGKKGQVIKEVNYTLDKYGLEPKVYLSYDRIAMFGNMDPNLRVTFDFNIRGRNTALDLTNGVYGENILENGQVLMEVKTAGAIPVWMARILGEAGIFTTSFSKYGEFYKQEIIQDIFGDQVQKTAKGGSNCA